LFRKFKYHNSLHTDVFTLSIHFDGCESDCLQLWSEYHWVKFDKILLLDDTFRSVSLYYQSFLKLQFPYKKLNDNMQVFYVVWILLRSVSLYKLFPGIFLRT
jgi:hypothetical protein